MRLPLLCSFAAALALLLPSPAHATRTVCTITVNSADEREALRARLPKDDFRFVELVEKGRPDWLRSACRRQVQCDVLVVSGHFNAGEDFYSDRLENDEYLRVDELERASCSDSCPSLFAKLKEVYLFGCESLNPDPGHNTWGEPSRDRMRRIFAGVPAIYGFSSSAPVGPTAAMLINRYFDQGGSAIGSGRVNRRLLAVFNRNSMSWTAGVRPDERYAAYRRQVCQFFDERTTAAQKLRFVHALLRGKAPDAHFFERIEHLLESLAPEERAAPAFVEALAEISADEGARERFLAMERSTPQPPLRARKIAMAATLGWLTPDAHRAELVRLVDEMMARRDMGYAEVDLACAINRDGSLDGERHRITSPAAGVAQSAALACLGDAQAHERVLKALASGDDRQVQVAQVYLRHRPLGDPGELREVARDIARMPPNAAKVRALDTLGRLSIADRAILSDLSRAFAEARSVEVQRAIAEVFIRSDPAAIPRREVAGVLRSHRLRAPGAREDLIDVLLRRLEAS